jgi:hypothetical protein
MLPPANQFHLGAGRPTSLRRHPVTDSRLTEVSRNLSAPSTRARRLADMSVSDLDPALSMLEAGGAQGPGSPGVAEPQPQAAAVAEPRTTPDASSTIGDLPAAAADRDLEPAENTADPLDELADFDDAPEFDGDDPQIAVTSAYADHEVVDRGAQMRPLVDEAPTVSPAATAGRGGVFAAFTPPIPAAARTAAADTEATATRRDTTPVRTVLALPRVTLRRPKRRTTIGLALLALVLLAIGPHASNSTVRRYESPAPAEVAAAPQSTTRPTLARHKPRRSRHRAPARRRTPSGPRIVIRAVSVPAPSVLRAAATPVRATPRRPGYATQPSEFRP